MMHRFFPLAVLSTTLLSSSALHAELGSIAPVTLVLTVTSTSGALPDADKNGALDWEKVTTSATRRTTDYRTKFVNTKLTNAAFLKELVNDNVIPDVNYTLVMASNSNATPFGFYLIRKGEKTIVTTPIDVTSYLSFESIADSFLDATTARFTEQLSNSVVTTSYSANINLKGPVDVAIPPLQACGMYNVNLRYDAAQEIYLMSSAKIASVAGGYVSAEEDEQPITIEGSINFAASKPIDVAIFPVQND